jgi:microcystin degradation protein MlrC
MTKRAVIAMMNHETNTFSPVATPLKVFGKNGPAHGAAAYQATKGTRMPMGAYIDICEQAGWDIVTPVAAIAPPSGPVDAAAYIQICDAIVETVKHGCDALFLDLHGAMVVKDLTDDGEGTLLERVRKLAPDLPIAVALDLHGNVTDAIVKNATVVAGYKTYPHVDMYEAGDLAGRVLMRAMRGEIRPVMAWGNRPILAQTLCMNTDAQPMKGFIDLAKQAEREGALAATGFGGFPTADIHDAGLSAIVVADGDASKAQAWLKRMLDYAWEKRADFIYHAEPLAQSIARAKAVSEAMKEGPSTGLRTGPVLLLDHCDNTASGAAVDVMLVLKEVLAQGLTDITVGPVRDPASVEKMIAAGVGQKVSLDLGGKTDMPMIGVKGEPLPLTGIVRAITDGEYTITGPQLTGMRAHMGRTAVLDTGAAIIVVTERSQEPWDLGVFTSVGIDPRRHHYLLLKSRMYYRPIFLPFAKAAIECDGVGVGSSNYKLFPYKKLRRPMYPLDGI